MKINYINGDLFDNIPETPTIIAHVCNDKSGFSAGFVNPLSSRYPVARLAYMSMFNKADMPEGVIHQPTFPHMGNVQLVKLEENLFLANMIAQTLGGDRPLYYNHLSLCMDKVKDMCSYRHQEFSVIAPMFGSALAGGNWLFIEELIKDCWLREGIDVTVCYLPQFGLPSNWTPPVENENV